MLVDELRRVGLEPIEIEGRLLLPEVPPDAELAGLKSRDGFFVLGDDPEPAAQAYLPGAVLADSGTLTVRDFCFAVTRFVAGVLRPVGERIGEAPGNLQAREGWFRGRR